jgi:3-hydroxyisobutyrate dehydrogenase-like beta-hydroxyacid dehydrogenase
MRASATRSTDFQRRKLVAAVMGAERARGAHRASVTSLSCSAGDPVRHEGAAACAEGDDAAAFKLFGNLTLLGILGILGDVGRLAAAVGIDMKDAFSLFEHFNPGQTLPQRAKRMSAGVYDPPSFEMSMARKDLLLMVEEAARGGQTLAMVPALAKLLDEGIARGEGQLDVVAWVRVPKP